jgi:hypothetical protein
MQKTEEASGTDLLLPGGQGAELSGLGDGPALAGGRVLLPLDRRPVGHEIFFVAVGPHGGREAPVLEDLARRRRTRESGSACSERERWLDLTGISDLGFLDVSYMVGLPSDKNGPYRHLFCPKVRHVIKFPF